MLTEYACCPRCLGDFIEQDGPGRRQFACLQCGQSGEVLPADEYVAGKAERAAPRREVSPNPSLTTTTA